MINYVNIDTQFINDCTFIVTRYEKYYHKIKYDANVIKLTDKFYTNCEELSSLKVEYVFVILQKHEQIKIKFIEDNNNNIRTTELEIKNIKKCLCVIC